MIENELNTRIRHAVEENHGQASQTPANNSTPKKGEIVFSSDLSTFKVGNGSTQYSSLPNFCNTETWTITLSNGTTYNITILKK